MRICIILVIAVASCASSVYADGYKDASDAAYCVGVYQSELDHTKSMVVRKKRKIRGVELNEGLKEEFIRIAVKQGKIDAVTASKLKDVGYADGKLCIQNTEKCLNEWNERSEQKLDANLNGKQLADCNKNTETVCERALKKCQ
jgi:hypothetical protein